MLKNISNATIGGLTPSTMSSADVWKQIVAKRKDQEAAQSQKDEKVGSLAQALAGGLRAAEGRLAADASQAGAQRSTVAALLRDLDAEKNRSVADATLQSYKVEMHRKFSMPVACLIFAFFAFPVGLRARRSGRTVGFGVGLFVAIVYWGLLIAGQTFGVRMSLAPGLSMWFPDALVLVAGGILFAAGARR